MDVHAGAAVAAHMMSKGDIDAAPDAMHGGQRRIPAASCKRLLRARVLAVRVLPLALLLAGACPAVAQQDPSSAAAANADAAVRANDELSEVDALALLRALEVKLSLSQALSSAELASVVACATSPHVSVRALSVAVLSWLDTELATSPLLQAWLDAQPRVRAGAAQSLLSLARRLGDEDRRRVVAASLIHLDDAVDEVACASAELLGALAPAEAADAVRARAQAAGDVRYACFARVGELPVRAVELPVLPAADAPSSDASPTSSQVPSGHDDGTWLLVSVAASTGLVVGALLPAGLVPSHDVLLYDDDSSRVTRVEVAVATQLGAGLVGALALGSAAWAIAQVEPHDVKEAAAAATAVAALGLAGASAQLVFGLSEGPAALATAGGLVLGLAGGAGLFLGAQLDVNDEVLAASSMALGGLGFGLLVFSAIPVALLEIGAAKRVDFGLGIAGLGAGVAGFGALAAGALFDVRAARSFAVLAGGLVGGGLGTALGFAIVPPSDVKSRIACTVGLVGLVAGMGAGLLVPEHWLPAVGAMGSAVIVEDGRVSMGVPIPFSLGAIGGLGATLVHARF